MKHQAITNLKFKALASRLSLPLWQTVGVLESLWLFAIHHARDGDLTRFRPSDLAVWLEYDGDADALVSALVATRWLDRQGDAVVIHDWAEHRPTWLKGIAARELSGELSSTLSNELSSPSPSTKCATKQVGLGIGTKSNNTSKGKRSRNFKIPTPTDVQAYCDARGNGIDGQEFVDHYEQIGWVCGKNRSPMRDWKAAVRTWENNRKVTQSVSRVATAADLKNFNLVTGAPQ